MGSNKGDAISGIVHRIVKAHPEAPARTLARRIVEECNGAITLEQARARVRVALGLSGEAKRKEHWVKEHYREPRPAGTKMAMPPSQAEPWLPFDLGITGKVGILSDIHVPYHDETALRADRVAVHGGEAHGHDCCPPGISPTSPEATMASTVIG